MDGDEKLIGFRVLQDIVINNINTTNPDIVERNEASRINKSLIMKDYPYDAKFWDNYNYIKETPLEAKLIADLESKVSLEDQFLTKTSSKKK